MIRALKPIVSHSVARGNFPLQLAHRRISARGGFTLMEILTVLAIMAVVAAVAMPATTGLQGAGRLNHAVGDISTTLEQARTYAMANNTYVYLGFQEVSEQSPGSSTAGVGRIAVAAVASVNGNRPPVADWGTPNIVNDVVQIARPEFYDDVHLSSAAALTQDSNMTSRPSGTGVVDLGGDVQAITPFQLPLTGAPRNSFTKVIEFDPQGTARIQASGTYDTAVSAYLELPLVRANGAQGASGAQMADQAAVQVDGVTGVVRIYRP